MGRSSLPSPIQDASLGAALAAAQTPAALSRRDFLKVSGSATGLVLTVPLAGRARFAGAAQPAADAGALPGAFIRIDADDLVHIVIKHHEMGQGATTGLATIAADELDADWSLVRCEYAPSNPKLYNNLSWGPAQGTGGSSSVANSWMQMRRAGASARALLVNAAAQAWNVPASEITAASSRLSHASGKSARYGEMAAAAARLQPPVDVPLKDPSQFTLIGKNGTRRVDSAAKCNGSAIYAIDVQLPGLLTAMITQPPVFGARLVSFDASAAKAVPGVTDVVQVPEGVAIVGTGSWPVLKARKLLKLEWDTSATQDLSSAGLIRRYRALAAQAGTPIHRSPGTADALKGATKTVSAVYEFPFLAHAPMEPMNCVAWLHDGRVETWAGHQAQTLDHFAASKAAGVPMERVTLNTLISGGSFGRRANQWSDFTVAAVNVAKAIGGRAPVRVQYTREDDMRAGMYRPAYVHQAQVALDAQGRITGWQHAIVGQSIFSGGPFADAVQNGVDGSSVEGVWPSPYAIPEFSGDLHSVEQPVRPLWWRSVGHTHTAFVMETLMDELAAAAGRDAVEFRLSLLAQQPRFAAVLQLAADKAGWGKPVAPGHALGIAVHQSFDTYVAEVAEVSLGANGVPRVHRVVVAVDCGVPVNPDQIRAQMEGGVGFALSAALYGEISIEHGQAQQTNFNTYRVIRIHEMPQVEVHIVHSGEAPTGVGEPGVPPLAPAVANALFRITGQRTRRLPFVTGSA